jgi:hypothetical protein
MYKFKVSTFEKVVYKNINGKYLRLGLFSDYGLNIFMSKSKKIKKMDEFYQ